MNPIKSDIHSLLNPTEFNINATNQWNRNPIELDKNSKNKKRIRHRTRTIVSKTQRRTIERNLKKKIYIATLIFSLLIGLVPITVKWMSIRQIYGNSEWKSSNSQLYLEINAADPYEIGYLAGEKLTSQIFNLYKLLIVSASSFDLNYLELKKLAIKYENLFTNDEIEEMNGILDGFRAATGYPLDFKDILLQNTWLDIIYGELMPNLVEIKENNKNIENLVGCTLLGLVLPNGSVVIGQNFDFIYGLESCLSYVLVNNNEISDKNNVSNFSYLTLRIGGSIAMPIGKNSKNIVSTISVVKTNLPGILSTPITARSLRAFKNSVDSNDFFNRFFLTNINLEVSDKEISKSNLIINTTNTGSFSMLISDSVSLYSIDSLPNMTILEKPSLAVKSNTFSRKEWQHLLSDPLFSKERQSNAEYLLNKTYNLLNQTYSLNQTDSLNSLRFSNEINKALLEVLENDLIENRGTKSTDLATLAFITSYSFGIGKISEDPIGTIPLIYDN